MKRFLPSFVWNRHAVIFTFFIGVVAIMIFHSEKPVVAKANPTLTDEGPMPELDDARHLAQLCAVAS